LQKSNLHFDLIRANEWKNEHLSLQKNRFFSFGAIKSKGKTFVCVGLLIFCSEI
jgi:hypothetical protein